MEGLISLQYVPTKGQLANILTKPLTGVKHPSILSQLGVLSPSNLRGRVNIMARSVVGGAPWLGQLA